MKRWRSSKFGRYVTRAEAEAHPDTTQGETQSPVAGELADALWRNGKLEAAMIETIDDLTAAADEGGADGDRCTVLAAQLEKALRD
jgi:hypothetical protein